MCRLRKLSRSVSATLYEHLKSRKGPNFWVLGFGVIVIIVQGLGKYMIIGFRPTRSPHRRPYTTYIGFIGMMDKKMETTIVYWGYIGVMEKKMEASVVYWGYRDNGKENGNYYNGL